MISPYGPTARESLDFFQRHIASIAQMSTSGTTIKSASLTSMLATVALGIWSYVPHAAYSAD